MFCDIESPYTQLRFLLTVSQQPVCYATERTGPAIKTEYMPPTVNPSLPNTFTRGGSALHSSMQAPMVMPPHPHRIGTTNHIFSAQNPNTVLMQGINGGIGKTDAGYSGSSPYMFGADSSVLDARPVLGDTSIASLGGVESGSQALGEPFLDQDNPTFGFLGQIPRNFSLSDLTADFSQSSGLLYYLFLPLLFNYLLSHCKLKY